MPAPRILVTRSPHQSSALAESLRALNLDPILIPTIELAAPTTFTPLDAALAHFDTFHWLLFTSANAVEAFHHRLSPNPNSVILSEGHSPKPKDPDAANPTRTVRPFLPPNLRVAAIGPATAQALKSHNLPVHLLPPQAIAESLTEDLLPHAHQPDGTPTRFLLLRAEAASNHLPDTLRAAGAHVTIAPAYRTLIPSGSISSIRHLFASKDLWPSAITFTSSSTATNLLALLEAAGTRLPQEILRISIGPVTSQTLRDLNLPPHAEAIEPTIPALIAAVIHILNLNNLP
jgi:uroporphyrinogen-III synthase